jgi:hypothetical protein
VSGASARGVKLPLAIMTSDDTHARTEALLKSHDYFGMSPDQVRPCSAVGGWLGAVVVFLELARLLSTPMFFTGDTWLYSTHWRQQQICAHANSESAP